MTGMSIISHRNAASSKTREPARSRITAGLMAGVLVITAIVAALSLMPSVSAPEIEMTHLGESMQEVGYGESAVYNIGIWNSGDERTKLIELELTGIPENWHAEITDPYTGHPVKFISMAAGAGEVVRLTVTAPTTDAAADAEENGGLEHVAAVGIRGGNATIGTVTVLQGTLELLREGNLTTLSPAHGPFELESGDLLTAKGHAVVEIDLSKLFPDTGGNGTIYVGLNDAVVGFWRDGDTAFMWIESGRVAIMHGTWSGGSAGGSRSSPTRGDYQGEWVLVVGPDERLNASLPGLEYGAALSFGVEPSDVLFSMAVYEDGETSAEVYRGSLTLENQLGNATLDEMESTTVSPSGTFPSPGSVQATILEVESDGSTEATITVNGRSVYDVDGAYIMVGTGATDLFIIPTDPQDFPDIAVTLNGNVPGEYGVTFSVMTGNTLKEFKISGSSTTTTLDRITLSKDMVTVDGQETGKTYDLAISYKEKGGDGDLFLMNYIRTSMERQVIAVLDWDNLADVVGAVEFTQGDITVKAENGKDGDWLQEQLDKEAEDEDEEELPIYLYAGIVVFILALVIFLFFVMGGRGRDTGLTPPGDEFEMESEESGAVKEGSGMLKEEFGAPGEGSGVKGYPQQEEAPASPGKQVLYEGGREDSLAGDFEKSRDMAAAPGAIPGKVMEAESVKTIFPLGVECHNCGKKFRIKAPAAYRCTGCHTPFKIDEQGNYHRPLRRSKTDDTGKVEKAPKCPSCGFDGNRLPNGGHGDVRCARCYVTYRV